MQQNKDVTFGDIPVGNAFIDGDGDFCIKFDDDNFIKNTFVLDRTGNICLVVFHDACEITRVIGFVDIFESNKERSEGRYSSIEFHPAE